MRIIRKIKQLREAIRFLKNLEMHYEQQNLLLAKSLVENVQNKKNIRSLKEVEFKVFSQWGDDGIIQWLIHHIDIPHKIFIEFGVEDYRESNTRFLMMNDNWTGFVMDSSKENILRVKNSEYYWKYELNAEAVFIDCDNINELISSQSFNEEIGLLHIDLDGNDYWIWKQINVIKPVIVIMEYNSLFGIDRAITIPYQRDFHRTKAHFSNLYYGASLKALYHLAKQKGYAFIGSNSAGNNAYFILRDKLNDVVKEVSLEKGYILLKSRESRDQKGNLTHTTGEKRIEIIRGMPMYNIITEELENL